MKKLSPGIILLVLALAVGCAGVPVRDAVKVDMKLQVGEIEGQQFTGMRYPFKVTAPPGWQMATQYPKFMLDLGYHKEGLADSELFLFSPATRSNVQIDFEPAGRHAVFDQPKIEALTNAVTGEMQDELKEHLGKNVKSTVGPLERPALKGVPYAAKRYVTYQAEGVPRQQGWIYAFAEPYQIFILYMIIEKEGSNDLQALQAILDSFEYLPKK